LQALSALIGPLIDGSAGVHFGAERCPYADKRHKLFDQRVSGRKD
jgi:hypothetical protein